MASVIMSWIREQYEKFSPWSGYVLIGLGLVLALVTKNEAFLQLDPMAVLQVIVSAIMGWFGLSYGVTKSKSVTIKDIGSKVDVMLSGITERVNSLDSVYNNKLDVIKREIMVDVDKGLSGIKDYGDDINGLRVYLANNVDPIVQAVAKQQMSSVDVSKDDEKVNNARNESVKKRGRVKKAK